MGIKKQVEKHMREDEQRALRAGKTYRTKHGGSWVSYYATLVEAEANREKIIQERSQPPTPEEFAGPDPLHHESIWIEHYNGLTWERVEGTERSIPRGVRNY